MVILIGVVALMFGVWIGWALWCDERRDLRAQRQVDKKQIRWLTQLVSNQRSQVERLGSALTHQLDLDLDSMPLYDQVLAEEQAAFDAKFRDITRGVA